MVTIKILDNYRFCIQDMRKHPIIVALTARWLHCHNTDGLQSVEYDSVRKRFVINGDSYVKKRTISKVYGCFPATLNMVRHVILDGTYAFYTNERYYLLAVKTVSDNAVYVHFLDGTRGNLTFEDWQLKQAKEEFPEFDIWEASNLWDHAIYYFEGNDSTYYDSCNYKHTFAQGADDAYDDIVWFNGAVQFFKNDVPDMGFPPSWEDWTEI